jgi:hypothetical protein
MRKALMLAVGSLLISSASAAMADICTDHGYPMGTQGYLECWHYVNEVNRQNQAQDRQLFRDMQNWGAAQGQQQPQQPTFVQPAPRWCPNGAQWCR